MKHISQLGDNRRRIAELEAEVIKLQRCLAERDAAPARHSTPGIRNTTVSVTQPHFALPTRSSQRKARHDPKVSNTGNDEPRRVVYIGHSAYTYKNGTPVSATFDKDHKSYMKPTDASSIRAAQSTYRKPIGWNWQLPTQSPTTPNWDNYSDGASSETVPESSEEAELRESLTSSPSSLTPPSEQEVAVAKPDRTMEKTSRLDEWFEVDFSYVRTNSKKNLDYLRRGLELAQKAIHKEWCKDGLGSDKAEDFGDGPHTIRLGYGELRHWLPEFPLPNLARYGYDRWTIHEAIFGVVDLRNTVSHPAAYELRDPYMVDRYLRAVQLLCIVLQYDDGVSEVRELRDSLLADGEEVSEFIQDMHSWSSLPFAEDREVEQHHIAMFVQRVRSNYCLDEKDEILHSIATRWLEKFPERAQWIRPAWS